MDRAELIELVRAIRDGSWTEDEADALLNTLQDNVLDPAVLDYIYWPKAEMTPEDIVDRALSYRPFVAGWTDS